MLNSRYVYNKLCNLPPSVITSVPCDRILKRAYCLERFSFQCQKVIGFAFTTLRDWLKKLAPLFRTIRSKTNTNRDSLVRVFKVYKGGPGKKYPVKRGAIICYRDYLPNPTSPPYPIKNERSLRAQLYGLGYPRQPSTRATLHGRGNI